MSWDIVHAEQIKLNKEIVDLTATEQASEQSLDEVLDATDLGATIDPVQRSTTRLIKSPERLKREQLDADAHQKAFLAEQAELEAQAKAEAAKNAKAAKAGAARRTPRGGR